MIREQLTQPSTRSVLLVVLVLCLAVGLVFTPGAVAQSDSPTDDDPEPVPASYYGNVTVVGDADVDGIEVTAEVEGTEYGPLVTDDDGEYGGPAAADEKLVIDPEDAPDDPEVTFFIESDEIDRTEVTQTDSRDVEWEEGDTQQVDLDIVLDDQDLPNLAATIVADDEQQLENDLEAEVLVENLGETSTDDPAQLAISAEGSPLDSDDTVELSLDDEVGELDPGENETVDISDELTEWSQDNETVDDVEITADVDPENDIQESSTSTNFDQTTVDVTYVNLEADASTRDSVVEGQNITLRSFITNDGTAAVADRDVNVTVDNGDSAEYNFTIDELESGEQFADRTRESFDQDGEYDMTVEIEEEDDDIFTDDYTANSEFTVKEYNLTLDDAENMRVPAEVRNGSSFTTTFLYEANASAPVNATIDLPDSDELELQSNENETKTVDSSTGNNTVSWRLNATDTTDENLSIDVDVEDTLGVEETDNVTVNTSVPQSTERIRDTNATVLGPEEDATEGEDRTGEFELQVRDSDEEDTEQQNVTLSLEGGAEGRTLSGLEYLVRYPYGCVEQTTSSFLGALNTKQYYEERPDADISDDQFDRINGSIEEGIDRLDADGERGQLEDGGWNFWGRENADSDTFPTSYALLGISSVAEDDDYDEVENSDINFTGAVDAIEDDQLDGGAFDARSYFRDKNSMTGFTMVTLNQTVEGHEGTDHADTASIQAKASDYLVTEQQDSGAWQDHDTAWNDPDDSATSTGLAIWGLQAALDNDDIDDEWDNVDTDEEEVKDAIEDGHEWLIENQLTDADAGADNVDEDAVGSWDGDGYHNSRWWSPSGDTSEEAAFATLGLDATNETADVENVGDLNRSTDNALDNSTDFLTGVYETGGSWGYTRASTFAIGALTEVTGEFDSDVTVEVTLEGEEESEELTIDGDDPEERITLTEDSDGLQDVRDASEDGTVTVEVEQIDIGDDDDDDTLNTVVVAVDNEQIVVEEGGVE